jgi:hypothetical protein
MLVVFTSFSCPWIRIQDPDAESGSKKSLNLDPIRIWIYTPAHRNMPDLD